MLARLTFNVTQVCNLRCVYCYAHWGDYGGPAIRMQPNLAVSKLQSVAERHSSIQLIQFIGGEPLLNLRTIRAICEATNRLVSDSILEKLPRFGIVTNLTVLNQSMLATFKDLDMVVVVSLDGPEEVHDKLRLTSSNKPTHKIVTNNLHKLIAENIPIEIEATFTRLHLEHHLSIVDLLRYFSYWNPRKIHIASVISKTSDRLGFYADNTWRYVNHLELEALNYVISELEKGNFVPYGLFIETISTLKSKDHELFCPAGASNLAISADGDFYACHMLTNNTRYRFNGDQVNSEKELFGLILSKKDFLECRSCWAKKWCKVCIGRMEMRFPGKPQPFIEQCERTRRSIELVMQRLPNAL